MAELTAPRRPGLVLALALLLAGCDRACARPASLAQQDGGDAFLHRLKVETLAKTDGPVSGIGLEGDHVYFATGTGLARVPMTGGPIEALDGGTLPADPRRAYYGGIGALGSGRAHDAEGDGYEVDAHGVYRLPSDGGRVELARAFPVNIERKVLLVDDERVYWLEPAASAVLSVPRHGGDVVYVAEAWVPVHYDLALSGDRVYLFDIDGALESAARAGGDQRYVGSLSSDLGFNRNGVWCDADGGWLYVVAEAGTFTSPGPVVIDPNKPLPPHALEMKYDSRVVRVELSASGDPLEPQVGGLSFFGTNVWLKDDGTPEASDVARMSASLAPVKAVLAAGKVAVKVAVTAGPAAGAAATARLQTIEAALRRELGDGLRVEREVRPFAVDAGPEVVGHGAWVGIDRRDAAALFAP